MLRSPAPKLAGLLDTRTGTVGTIDLGTGVRSTYASGLAMPNGLARSESGDLFTTRNLGTLSGLTRVAVDGSVSTVRTDLGSANGIGIGEGKIYVANTFDLETTLTVLDEKNPSGPAARIRIDGVGHMIPWDDLEAFVSTITNFLHEAG